MSGTTMKAAVRHAYGPPEVLRLEEIQRPAPADDELLIRVRAASVNLGDCELLTGDPLHILFLARCLPRDAAPRSLAGSGRRVGATVRKTVRAQVHPRHGCTPVGIREPALVDSRRPRAARTWCSCELFEAGKMMPVIDRSYPLRGAAEAIRRVGEKQARGKIVITP